MKKPIHQALDRQLSFEVSSLDVQKLFAERSKSAMAQLGLELLEQDIERLTGKPFVRKGDELAYRGGSAPSSLLVDGAKVSFTRTRVRDAKGHEVPVPMLSKLRDQDLHDEQIAARVIEGASTRKYQGLIDTFSKKTGIAKSSVSRAFKRASQKDLDAINHADLSGYTFMAILIDGTNFDDKTVVAAVGITPDCQKIPLGLKEGTTENAGLVKDLLTSLVDRGFKMAASRLLAVLDGGKALKCAVKALWGDNVVIQRCWIHKLRNIRDYLPKENHGQLWGRMKKIMGLTTVESARTEVRRLRDWLSGISDDAVGSLDECGADLLTVHELGLSGDLRRALSSTNLIESMIGVVKSKSSRVSNWKYHPKLKSKIKRDKILRWVASSIEAHRPRMKRLRGMAQAPALVAALNNVDQIKISA